MKSVWFAEECRFWERLGKFSVKETFLFCGKGGFFCLCKAMKQWKAFYKPTTATLFYHAQTNGSQQISSVKSYCELAVHLLFFETSQSCVSSMATLSHRFKSSPAIPGKVVFSGTAGYLMNAGHFRENHVSSGDLNRRSQDGVPRAFWLLFARRKKWQLVLFAENIEVFQTSIQLAAMAASHEQN